MYMDFSYEKTNLAVKIKVIGVGDAGGNAINNMIESNLIGVDFIIANTDIQVLDKSNAKMKIQIGSTLTQGLGAGMNPAIGREAALESKEALKEALEGSNIVFIIAGFGGGTGTGAASVVAEICKEISSEVLTVAVITKPFSFEGKKRITLAEEGIEILKEVVDTVITIPYNRLREIVPKNAIMRDIFKQADEILLYSVKGITDLITMPGFVNLDFADVKTIMSKAGMALMGIGMASGDNRAKEAVERAISHPLLEDISISGVKGVLLNITSSSDLQVEEVIEASERIYEEVGDEAEIIWGHNIDEDMGDEIRVTVIATGIEDSLKPVVSIRKKTESEKLRGRVIVVMPEGYNKEVINLIELLPSFKRHSKLTSDMKEDGRHKPVSFDNDNLEGSVFLRRKAD